jgi:catechol 2,3-dioxygenase-like lactoylglutathione lyase family enzyme
MPRPRLRWTYTGIRVRNLSRSIRFYRTLGFRVAAKGRMEHGGVIVDLRFPGTAHVLELNYYPRANRFYEPFRPGSALDHLGLLVDDIEGWVRRLRRARRPIVADWTERGTRLVYTSDPDGNWIEVCGRARPLPDRRTSRRRG